MAADFAPPRITQELKNTLLQSPNIKEVYFTGDGHHHFRCHKGPDGNSYTRMAEVPEKKGNLYTGKSVIVPIMDGNKPDLQYAVVTSKTRQEVLEMPVNASSAGEQMLAEATGGNTAKITKADVLGLLEISEDEFAAIIAKKNKK
jgi:hypothetical protein